jgi:choline dehydrogenase-like flavoprotein
VLAARLSADPAITVLVIEAGSHEYSLPFTHVPGLVPLLQQTHIDWMFKTVVQNQSTLTMNGQVSAESQSNATLHSNRDGRVVDCWAARAFSTTCWRTGVMPEITIGGTWMAGRRVTCCRT